MINRERIDPLKASDVLRHVGKRFNDRLLQHGPGVAVSLHEILGIVAEESHEVFEAVVACDRDETRAELVDLAVACLLGIASIDTWEIVK